MIVQYAQLVVVKRVAAVGVELEMQELEVSMDRSQDMGDTLELEMQPKKKKIVRNKAKEQD